MKKSTRAVTILVVLSALTIVVPCYAAELNPPAGPRNERPSRMPAESEFSAGPEGGATEVPLADTDRRNLLKENGVRWIG